MYASLLLCTHTCSILHWQINFFQVSKAACILTTQHLTRILRSKEAAASVNIKTWPTIIDTGMRLWIICLRTRDMISHFYWFVVHIKHSLLRLADDLPRRRPPQIYKPPTAEMIAYLDFSVSTTGMLTGVKVRLDDNLLNYCPGCSLL